MTWHLTDDAFYDHPKVRAIPRRRRLAAVGLWALAAGYTSRHLTDGHLNESLIEDLTGTPAVAADLVAVGLWHTAGHDCQACPPLEAGYLFHDWREWNASRADVETKRESAAVEGLRGNHKRWHEARGVVAPDCPHCIAPPTRTPDRVPDSPPTRTPDRV